MAALRVSRGSLQRRYRDRTKTLLELSGGLPDRPTPDDVHDLRVTARRIQMIRRLLPRAVRESPDSSGFDLALRSVMKSTSQLRDLDTLIETLEAHRAGIPDELLVSLENQRSDAAARARAPASVLTDITVPDLEPSDVKGKRASRRLRKRVKKGSRSASELLTDVLNDEDKVEELHSLRKEIKKLRYLLELADGGAARVPTLTKWQESLGAIHDLDVAISYLEELRFDDRRRAIRELRRARHANYVKFVRDYRTAFIESLGERRRLPVMVSSDPGFAR